MKLLRTEYEVAGDTPIVWCFCRDDQGNRQILKDSTFKPYFYIDASECGYPETPFRSIYGRDVVKLYTSLPKNVSAIRDDYPQHYEADVLFPTRYMIDMVDELEPCKVEVMFVDIETGNAGRVPDPFEADQPIVCLTAYQNGVYHTFIFRQDFHEKVETRDLFGAPQLIYYYNNERAMMKAFIEYVRYSEPDVLTGWNCLGFDFPFIINRMKKLGLSPDELSPMGKTYVEKPRSNMYGVDPKVVIKGLAAIDMLKTYKIITGWTEGEKESYTLDEVGKEVLGYGKIGNSENINYDWEHRVDDLILYNAQDVRICVEVDKKKKLMSFVDEIRRVCFCQFEDALVASRMVDAFILKLFHGRVVLPSKGWGADDEHVEGGEVENNARKGIYENVCVADISSEYPSAILAGNISTETMRNEWEEGCVRLGNFWVQQNVEGYLPEVVRVLIERKKYYGKLRDKEVDASLEWTMYNYRRETYKRIINALYGLSNSDTFRLKDYRVSDAITWMGRTVNEWGKQFIIKKGFEVIYRDTDSLHFPAGDMTIEDMQSLVDDLNASHEDFVARLGLSKNYFESEFEKVYRRIFYRWDVKKDRGMKKRYAGHVIWKGKPIDKLEVKGFETKRSDSSRMTKRVMTRFFEMVLKEDKTEREVSAYLADEVEKIKRGEYDLFEISIPKGLTKGPYGYFKGELNKYLRSWEQAGLGANVRGVLYGIEVLGLELGNKPRLVYVKAMPEGLPKIDVLCFDDPKQIPEGVVIDTDTMIDKVIVNKMEKIYAGLGWEIQRVWGEPIQQVLF